MSLDDVFGAFPGRPNHPDFRLLVDVVLEHDGKTEDPNFDMRSFLAEYIDPESLEHMATQRGMRFVANAGKNPAMNAQVVAMLGAMFLSAFTIGCEYQKRRDS